MRSMHSWIVPAAVAVLAGGCTYDELRETSNVEKTMADLRFEGILNNLAMMANNPAAMPNPVAVSTGNVSVSDLGTASTNDAFNPHGLTQWQLAVASLQRQVTEQWALQPLHKPDKLRLMRCRVPVPARFAAGHVQRPRLRPRLLQAAARLPRHGGYDPGPLLLHSPRLVLGRPRVRRAEERLLLGALLRHLRLGHAGRHRRPEPLHAHHPAHRPDRPGDSGRHGNS